MLKRGITYMQKEKIEQYVIPAYQKKRTFYHSQTYFHHAKEAFYRIVEKEKPESILDVGCGHGLDYKPLISLGVRYVGIDPTEANLEQARLDYPDGDFRLGFAQELSFKDESFEWVWMCGVWDVLGTLQDMEMAAREALRVAKRRVYSLDATAKPRFMTERYMMVPMNYGLSITRVNYNPEKQKADYLWCIDKEGIK
jgi:ubiquinone/menaquinone biosynthesis C-methylase UbiE